MTKHRFETPGDVALRVVNASGSVELTAHRDPSTEVEVHCADADFAEQVKVEHRGGANRHQVSVEVPSHGLRRGGQPDVSIVVRLPEGATLDVETASADVRADGRFGEATFASASGCVEVDEIDGQLAAKTASGEIEVGSVAGRTRIDTASGQVRCEALGGDSRISTASGDVSVGAAHGRLDIRTASGDAEAGEVADDCRLRSASGDLQVGRAVAGKVQLQTVNGTIVVGVARGTAVRVDAESVSGHLSSEIDLDEQHAGGGDGPHLDLRARSVSGDVRVERAEAPAG